MRLNQLLIVGWFLASLGAAEPCAAKSAAPKQRAVLELSIRTDATSYLVGEPVKVEYVIANLGKKSVRLPNIWPDRVVLCGGSSPELVKTVLRDSVDESLSYFQLSPGAEFVARTEILNAFGSAATGLRLDQDCRYEIRGTLKYNSASQTGQSVTYVWKGSSTSSAYFDVHRPTANESLALRARAATGDQNAIAAVSLLADSDAIPSLVAVIKGDQPNKDLAEYGLFVMDSTESLRVLAAVALSKGISPSDKNGIIQFLGEAGSSVVVPALLELAKDETLHCSTQYSVAGKRLCVFRPREDAILALNRLHAAVPDLPVWTIEGSTDGPRDLLAIARSSDTPKEERSLLESLLGLPHADPPRFFSPVCDLALALAVSAGERGARSVQRASFGEVGNLSPAKRNRLTAIVAKFMHDRSRGARCCSAVALVRVNPERAIDDFNRTLVEAEVPDTDSNFNACVIGLLQDETAPATRAAVARYRERHPK